MKLLPLALLTILAASPAASAEEPARVIGPQEAVAFNIYGKAGVRGRFEMTVASTGRERGTVFLNSADDYRRPDNLTFRLSPNVAKSLQKRFDAAPEVYLRGKHVVIDGTFRNEPIVNTEYGRAVSFNRWQHMVRVILPHQVVAVD